MSDLRALEEELVETNREVAQLAIELEERNKQLDAFATAVGHDLKSPVVAARLAAQLARHACAQGDQRLLDESLARVDERLGHMVRLIDGLLEYARATRPGQCVEPVTLGELVDSVLDALPVPQGFSIHCQAVPGTFVTDAPMLRQTLQNLIDNAIQHHDRDDGIVEVCVSRHRRGIAVSVSDDGPGIAANARDRIFEPFFSTRAGRGGTGLGLSLVRSIVRSHGGDVHVQTGPDGTCFRFDWPGRWAPAEPLQRTARPEPRQGEGPVVKGAAAAAVRPAQVGRPARKG